jgi:proteasome maturation protein
MEDQAGLPMYKGPNDQLRFGFRSLESEFSAAHPVDTLLKTSDEGAWNSKLDMVRRTYGSHMAMRLATEKMQFDKNHRLPGLPTSRVGLDILTGKDNAIDFTDYLNGKSKHVARANLCGSSWRNFFLLKPMILVPCFLRNNDPFTDSY